jgi:mRNA-degrading endonuclease RelE of RelBE toxin-antitoxin system
MSYRLLYASGARQLVQRLPPDLKPLVKQAIERLKDDPHAGKALRFDLAGYHSLASQRYRIIYRVRDVDRVVEIHHFGRRADVYEEFLRFVRRGRSLE